MELREPSFLDKEAAVDDLTKGSFRDKPLHNKDLLRIHQSPQNTPKPPQKAPKRSGKKNFHFGDFGVKKCEKWQNCVRETTEYAEYTEKGAYGAGLPVYFLNPENPEYPKNLRSTLLAVLRRSRPFLLRSTLFIFKIGVKRTTLSWGSGGDASPAKAQSRHRGARSAMASAMSDLCKICVFAVNPPGSPAA